MYVRVVIDYDYVMSKNGFVAYQIGKLIKNKVWIFYTLPQLE
jgi:hypothetical protein